MNSDSPIPGPGGTLSRRRFIQGVTAAAVLGTTGLWRRPTLAVIAPDRHGMWSELETPDGRFQVRKHTIAVQPAQRVSFAVTADAPGRWAFHCHLLYHMAAGVFREVVVA